MLPAILGAARVAATIAPVVAEVAKKMPVVSALKPVLGGL